MPSPLARSFILATKPSSLPAISSAMATQASLALATLIHLIMVSTVCVSPGSKKTWLPPMEAAYSDTVTSSVRLILPEFNASKIRINVMIFVMLAGCKTVSASFS